jgi:predicted phosphodiesterase
VIIGLIADTQGRFDLGALLEFVAREFAAVDEIWHAGDWGQEPVLDGLRELKPLVVVNGNAPDDPRYPMTVERAVGPWRLGMIHNLGGASRGWAERFDLVIHAHSHRWRDETVGSTRFINPGTATRPQFGDTERTMARLHITDGVQLEKVVVPKFALRAWV